jgi:hypothetical protein
MDELLGFLLAHATIDDAPSTVEDWWRKREGTRRAWPCPIDRAIALGFDSDRIGFAFAGGYHAALAALVPALGSDHLAALCATEEGGAHPRAIRTALTKVSDDTWSLHGTKEWATLGEFADTLLVVASVGADGSGRNRLRVARIARRAVGVRLIPMPAPPFAPEIPHARLELDDVTVSEDDLLPGDGYDDYLKPFRTIEDVYVHAALLGYLMRLARRHRFPRFLAERIATAIAAARGLALASPKAPAVHVALAGLIDASRKLIEEMEPHIFAVDGADGQRFARDRPLFDVAGKARNARRQRAWELLEANPGPNLDGASSG